MYINPFAAGCIATLLAELVGLIVYGVTAVILERRNMKKQFERYEAEKKSLERKGLSPQDYEKAIKELAERYGI